jgi:GntR family transcriptional regulator
VPEHPRGGLPLYLQIREALAEQILRGDLRPGAKIQGERELSEQYRVSRMTARQALISLFQAGLIRRVRGGGTFVAEPKIEQDVSTLRSFSEQMQRSGLLPGAKLLLKEEIAASRRVAEALQVNTAERVYRIVRLRTGNGQPIALENSFFPIRRLPGIINADLEGRSIYRIMEEDYHARPVRATQRLEPVAANTLESTHLEVPVGAPLMLLERIAYGSDGLALEYAKDVYRGDRSRFVMETMLSPEPARG